MGIIRTSLTDSLFTWVMELVHAVSSGMISIMAALFNPLNHLILILQNLNVIRCN